MTYRKLKWFTICLPPFLIGGFEYFRHEFILFPLSMETGNFLITLLTLVLSYLFGNWMFQTIERMNHRITEEQSKRAVYEERERLARELHDNIAQSLFFLKVNLKHGNQEEAQEAVAEIDHNLRQAIFNLRSLPQETISLSARLHKWLTEWSMVTGIEVSEELEQLDGYFRSIDEVQLFGIVQEAFMNIRKHSDASHASLKFDATPNSWQLTVIDDGKGIQDLDIFTSHFGLSMIRDRATNLGASFEIRQPDAGGTELILKGKVA